jgi:AGZA family xanthine/uracil permease-like MFS transporter
MFDNVAQLIVFSTILIHVFGYPADLVLTRMLPGTAFGVLVGDLIYTWLAFRLAARTGRTEVTAMPLGIDTVSLFGLTFGALGPVYQKTGDAILSWQVGMALMVVMGIFKVAMAWPAARLRRFVPAAAMLGTIGGIGVALIAFMPLLKVYASPAVGIVALFLVLLVLLRPPRLPRDLPPVLIAVGFATLLYYALRFAGLLAGASEVGAATALGVRLPIPTLGFVAGLELAVDYLPLAIPLAFATIIGGIDNTESAAAAGDEYDTRAILLTEGVSTLAAGLVGGVIQTTPYIGHPAYKRMGGRAASVVACFLPVLASVCAILIDQMLPGAGTSAAALTGPAASTYQALQILAAGFVFSAMLLGTATSLVIDGRHAAASTRRFPAAPRSFPGRSRAAFRSPSPVATR